VRQYIWLVMKGWTSLFEDYFASWCDFFGINRKGEHRKEEATIRQIFYFDRDELRLVRTLWMFHHRIKDLVANRNPWAILAKELISSQLRAQTQKRDQQQHACWCIQVHLVYAFIKRQLEQRRSHFLTTQMLTFSGS